MSPPFKPRAEWERQISPYADKVTVKALAVTATVGFDAWGRTKAQPVLISLIVSFKKAFDSAAATDQVDESTVHYGNLSKNVIAAVEAKSKEKLSMHDLMVVIEAAAKATIPSPESVHALELEVCLPKASLLGNAVCLQYSRAEWAVARRLHIKDLTLPTVVGVNDHEKKMKQQLLVNVWVDGIATDSAADHYGEVEQVVIKVRLRVLHTDQCDQRP
jgi:FolB domain-containing protein